MEIITERVVCYCGYAYKGRKCRSLPMQGDSFWHKPTSMTLAPRARKRTKRGGGR